jgi:hypothetical protein
LPAAPLVVRRTMLWPLRHSALRVLNRGAQADARPAVRAHASTVKIDTVRNNAKALGELLSRLAGSRDASGSAGREGRAYVMRVDDRARIT